MNYGEIPIELYKTEDNKIIKYVRYEEIERLNKELEQTKDNFDFNLGAIENIRKENHKLEDKIDKAIECIDKWRNYDGDYSVEEEELLEILKGSDKE